MAWLLALVVLVVLGAGLWALFRVDERAEGGGTLLGGDRTPRELPRPPGLPADRPWPPDAGREQPVPSASLRQDVPDHLAGFVRAGIGQRFLARIVDTLIAGFVSGIVGFIIAAGAIRRGSVEGSNTTFLVAILIFTLFYEVGFIAVLGQTPGKMFLGIRVISALDGQTPTVAQALVRWALPNLIGFVPRLIPGPDFIRVQLASVFGLVTLLVYLWAIWDPRNQGLHDKAAATLVERFR